MPYVSQIYSYSRTVSAEALGFDNAGFAVGSGSSTEDDEVSELTAVELSVPVVVVELSVLLVVVELSELLDTVELSGALTETDEVLSVLLETVVLSEELSDELSSVLDDVTVLLVVVELSEELELSEDELSAVLEVVVDEPAEELDGEELSGVLTEFSVSPEQAVIANASANAVIIAVKRFINAFPFICFIYGNTAQLLPFDFTFGFFAESRTG